MMKKYLKFLIYLLTENYNTIYFNFKCFPFKEAIGFPVVLSKNVYIKKLNANVIIQDKKRYGMIRIGFGDVGIFDEKKSRAILQLSGNLIFKGNAEIGHGCKISVGESGCVVFGKNFNVTAETSIVSHSSIIFGDNCLLSWEILIMDTDFHKVKDFSGVQINKDAGVIFGNNVWVGCRSTILKGSIIPDNCVIGANSLIKRKFTEENTIYSGNPAKETGSNILWSYK